MQVAHAVEVGSARTADTDAVPFSQPLVREQLRASELPEGDKLIGLGRSRAHEAVRPVSDTFKQPRRAGVMQGIAGDSEPARLSGGEYALGFRELENC